MSEWQEVKLKEVCEKITVGHVGSMADKYQEEGIPFLRSLNIKPFSLDFSNLKYIDQEFHRKLKKSSLFSNDVAVVRTGVPGTACVIPESLKEANCSDLVIIRPSKKLNPYFLACIFNSVFGKRLVAGNLVGVAQQHFNITVAKELKLAIPEKKIQDKIAAILSAYDELIENNQKRIALLEKAAEEIYREWFVRMRFPGWKKTKFEKGIPVGWEEIKLADAFSFTGGGTPSKKEKRYWEDGTINWYTPSDITGANGIFLNQSGDKCTEEGLNRSSARIFPAYSIMLTSRATIGAVGINTTPACTNQGFITCIPNEDFPLTFLYHWIKLSKTNFELLSTGATFAELTKGTFKKIKILKPEKRLAENYEEKAFPMFKKMEILLNEVELLKNSRDLLLSRLISGKLAVDELEIHFPPSMKSN